MKYSPAIVNYYSRKALDRLIMTRSAQRVLYYLGKDLQVKRYIFIVGCYNSGTTLLANILRAHPLIGGLPTEGAYLTDVLPYPERYGFPRMWTQCIEKMRINPEPEMSKKAERIKRHWSLWFTDEKQILVEKSVSNAVRMPFLNAFFKPAYFVYIVRNGYAVSKGIQLKANLKRWKSPYMHTGYPIEMCAEQWKATDEIVNGDNQNVEKFIRIYYEDLVKDPKRVTSLITDFLQVPAMPEDVFARNFFVHGVNSGIKDMNEAALARLEETDWAKIETVAGPELFRHGYMRR